MTRSKEAVKYQSVSLPVDFLEMVKEHIADRREYRSMADFIKESASSRIKQEKSKFLGPRGIAIKDWALKYKTLEIKIDSLENKIDSILESIDSIGKKE